MSPLPPLPRVSIPVSILDPPHWYRIHRRKSLEACDSLSLPRVSSRVGPGGAGEWGGCPCLAQVPRWRLRPREDQGLSQGSTARPSSSGMSAPVSRVQARPHLGPVLCVRPGEGGTHPLPGVREKCPPTRWHKLAPFIKVWCTVCAVPGGVIPGDPTAAGAGSAAVPFHR